MKINCEDYLGLNVFFENSSYCCPTLSLFGYYTERKLHSAIKREMKKKSNSWRNVSVVGNHKSPFGI